MTNYRNDDEARYYGSDLNKFVHEHCTKEMTANNIDLMLYRRSRRCLRIIESKHVHEGMKPSQRELLKLLAKVIKPVVDRFKLFDFSVYIVEGNYPYSVAQITDVSTDVTYTLEGDNFRKWLEFDYDITTPIVAIHVDSK